MKTLTAFAALLLAGCTTVDNLKPGVARGLPWRVAHMANWAWA